MNVNCEFRTKQVSEQHKNSLKRLIEERLQTFGAEPSSEVFFFGLRLHKGGPKSQGKLCAKNVEVNGVRVIVQPDGNDTCWVGILRVEGLANDQLFEMINKYGPDLRVTQHIAILEGNGNLLTPAEALVLTQQKPEENPMNKLGIVADPSKTQQVQIPGQDPAPAQQGADDEEGQVDKPERLLGILNDPKKVQQIVELMGEVVCTNATLREYAELSFERKLTPKQVGRIIGEMKKASLIEAQGSGYVAVKQNSPEAQAGIPITNGLPAEDNNNLAMIMNRLKEEPSKEEIETAQREVESAQQLLAEAESRLKALINKKAKVDQLRQQLAQLLA